MHTALPDPARPPHPPATIGQLPTILAPDRGLLTYYLLQSLLLGPFFFTLFIPRFFRFRTLRYEVDEEGMTMRWGILFRREVSLTYARIQDIHLSSNLLERWMGLAKIQIQTASGSSTAEMTIEGVRAFDAMRDFLYVRMRGARDHPPASGAGGAPGGAAADAAMHALTETMREVTAEVRALRGALAKQRASGGRDG